MDVCMYANDKNNAKKFVRAGLQGTADSLS